MKKVLHFSDIHFGAPHAPNRAAALLLAINRIRPAVVAISGDITQRARSAQFREAREFLYRISAPLIIVPGNHDVPLWNPFARFFSPLDKYKRWITQDLNPIYVDDEIAVMGLDSTKSFTIKGGRISSEGLQAVRTRLCKLPANLCRIIVTHHPMALPPGFEHEQAVGGVERALKLFEECGVELILTGHLHQTYITESRDLYPHSEHSILLVQAGTAATERGRGRERMKNSFNLIEIAQREIKVTNYIYSDEQAHFLADLTHVSLRRQCL